jgi:hypothetical protein
MEGDLLDAVLAAQLSDGQRAGLGLSKNDDNLLGGELFAFNQGLLVEILAFYLVLIPGLGPTGLSTRMARIGRIARMLAVWVSLSTNHRPPTTIARPSIPQTSTDRAAHRHSRGDRGLRGRRTAL